jgi:mannose/fructose/N-acetylgalactosamine-specific phosphotransferase system component IID
MYLVVIAWIYVVLMMCVAEATASQGSWLGALITLLLYGALPLSVVVYIMGTASRRRARHRRESALAQELAASAAPDAGSHSPAHTVAPVREKP